MVSLWRSKSTEQTLEHLMDKLQEIENVSYSFSQPVNESGRTFGIKGKGTGSGAFGATSGNQIFNPTRTPITSFDIQGVDQTILDRINITSRYMIVVGDDPTDLNVKWIQRATANGQPIYLQPENGKTLHLLTGGNIDIDADVDVLDTEIFELIFNEETDVTLDGGFTVVGLQSGGGGGATTFEELTDTDIVGIADQDVIQWNNSTSKWNNKAFLEFGGADTADVGFLRTGNNQVIFAGRNQANTGNFEGKIDSIFNYLDLTMDDNSPVGINLRAQDVIDPDQNLTLAQAGGNTGVGFLSAPNAFTIDADGGLGMRLDSNAIEMFQDVDMNDNEINQARWIAFSGTAGLNLTTTAGIEYDSVNDWLLYNVSGTLEHHRFDINGELMMTIFRSGLNEGTVQAQNFHATGLVQIDELADFSTFNNVSPSNGNIWLDSGTGIFNFHMNGVTSTFIGNPLQVDLDFNTFDAFNIDSLVFMGTPGSLGSLDVGFSSLGSGSFRANILDAGRFEWTEENIELMRLSEASSVTTLALTGILSSQLQLGETTTGKTGSILQGSTTLQYTTTGVRHEFLVGVEPITRITASGIEMQGTNFITTPQIGFSNLGNIIEDDVNGMIFKTIPTDDFTWSDGTNIFATLDIDGLFLNQLFIQFTSITSPGATGSSNVGELFMDTNNADHLSIIRNGGVIDLEGGAGATEFADDVFRVIGSVDSTKKLAFEVDTITTSTLRTITVKDASGTLPLLETLNNWSGTNTFTGTITNINSATTNIGDSAGDNINILGTIQNGIVYADGLRQTFNPSNTNAGLNVGSIADDTMSSPIDGDIHYSTVSGKFRFRENGNYVIFSELLGANDTLSNLVNPTAINQDLNLLGNFIVLDSDKDTSISSLSDDTMLFRTGGSIRMSLDNDGLTITTDIIVPTNQDLIFKEGVIENARYDGGNDNWIFNPANDVQLSPTIDIDLIPGGDIIMNPTGNIRVFDDLDMDGVNTIDMGTSASTLNNIPAVADGYFQIKENGIAKFVPFFNVLP